MSEHSKETGQHVFISYPRAHRDIAEKVVLKIKKAKLKTWIDDEKIEPGTDDWERCIRDGVKDAYAVVLLCSTKSLESRYVHAELVLAQNQDCPIIPIWISGNEWIDCVPLNFVNFQYLDCRGNLFDEGVQKLVDKLLKIVTQGLPPIFIVEDLDDCPQGFIPILMSKNEGEKLDVYQSAWVAGRMEPTGDNLQVIVVNPLAYNSFENLLDDLYTRYLRQRYPIYTYGSKWVIASPSLYVTIFALPLEWLRFKRKRLLVDVVHDYQERSTPLHTYGLHNKVWAIIDSDFEVGFGFCTSETIAFKVFNEHPKRLRYTLTQWISGTDMRDKTIEAGVYNLEKINRNDFKYQVLIAPDFLDEYQDEKVLIVK